VERRRRTNVHMRAGLASIVMVLVACTHDVHAVFPAPPDAPTGTLVLLLSQPAPDVTVAIGGVLVVERQRTRRVEVTNVPVGNAEVAIVANGSDKQLRAWIDDTRPTTIPLGVPDAQGGFVKSLLGSLITIVAWSLLH